MALELIEPYGATATKKNGEIYRGFSVELAEANKALIQRNKKINIYSTILAVIATSFILIFWGIWKLATAPIAWIIKR